MGASVVQQVFHMTEEEVAETAGGPRALTPAMTLLRAQKSYQDLAAAYGSISKLDRRELALADLEHAARQGLDKVLINVLRCRGAIVAVVMVCIGLLFLCRVPLRMLCWNLLPGILRWSS
jgi:hypothetical protein